MKTSNKCKEPKKRKNNLYIRYFYDILNAGWGKFYGKSSKN